MTTKEKLNNYLKENGVKLKFIATQTGVNYSDLSNWKTGKRSLSSGHIKKINEYLG